MMSGSPRALRILVLNDDPDLLALYDELLTDEGYVVATRLQLMTSVEELVALQPDLIILDLYWAGERHGVTFLVQVRSDPRTATVPIILCTGVTEPLAALPPHLDRLHLHPVAKPFNIDDLLATIRTALAH